MAVRNIIFDLGGVFIDIHYQRTKQAFEALGVPDFDALFQQSYANPLFAQLERGQVSPAEFYQQLRQQTGLQASDDDIARAWNAMLGQFRPGAVALLPQLAGQYRIFLLSNTNEIHYEAFSQQYQQQFGHAFDDHFEKAHYSHTLGQRKPDVACYQAVLQQHGLQAADTLFVDDTPKNLDGAAAAGLHTLMLAPGQQLEQQLPAWLAG